MPAAAASLIVATGAVTPLVTTTGGQTYGYANQTTVWVYRGRVLAVSTKARHCDTAGPTNCVADQPPSMWSDAVKALDPQAAAAANRAGGIDALNYDDRGGAGEAKPRVLDMYRRSLRSALAKASEPAR